MRPARPFRRHVWPCLFVLAAFLPCSSASIGGHALEARSTSTSFSPLNVSFSDCFTGQNVSEKLSVYTAYAQADLFAYLSGATKLNITIVGHTPITIEGYAEGAGSSLSTLFITADVLTLNVYSTSQYLCESLRPASPLPTLNSSSSDSSSSPPESYCPISPGAFALSATVPWGTHRQLMTFITRLRAVDSYSAELFCIDVLTTPVQPQNHIVGPQDDGDVSPYGDAVVIFWATVALSAAYFVVVGIARVVGAWGRGAFGTSRRGGRGVWGTVQSLGYVFASAISGERLATSPALLRFCTPTMRDVVWHTQWCAALVMIAVEWPAFVYPLLSQTAWSALVYNISLPALQSAHWNPLLTQSPAYAAADTLTSDFADQFNDSTSPLYLDSSVPNSLLLHRSQGIEAFAYSIGVHPTALWPMSIIIFLAIVAATIVISAFVWLVDHLLTALFQSSGQGGKYIRQSKRGFKSVNASKDMLSEAPVSPTVESKALSHLTHGSSNANPGSVSGADADGWYTAKSSRAFSGANVRLPKFLRRFDISSFHLSILQGNLVRLLLLFHFPLTIFSSYHMALPVEDNSSDVVNRITVGVTSRALAALSFTLICVLVPLLLILRVRYTNTQKLYSETRTISALGPLYDVYRPKNEIFAAVGFVMNVGIGVTIGCGQKSGIAQAVVVLVLEVASALLTSIWLPWGVGASMGLISFLMCVARIVIAVLLVILSPTVSIGYGPAAWVSYGILVILALVYVSFLLMLICKLIEAGVRVIGGTMMRKEDGEHSNHVVDTGLIGACGMLACCGGDKRRRRRRRRRSKSKARREMYNSGVSGQNTTFVAPAPQFGTSSIKESVNSGPPQSVLRPEHALQPYREDRDIIADDSEGYIMGAWQPFGNTKGSYSPVNSTTQSTPSKGFSRVGGGRANMDSPYAISAGELAGAGSPPSTHPFPRAPYASGPGGYASASVPAHAREYSDDSPPPSFSNVASASMSSGLPQTGLLPHVRTKSQTAIIEDMSALLKNAPAKSSPISAPPADSSSEDDESGMESDETTRPKKRPWYLRHSAGDIRQSACLSVTVPGGTGTDVAGSSGGSASAASTPMPGRSFVVIRKTQPSPGPSSAK
ncbi:hypothetical protein FISHEDRAFT_47247 [Fistulina hepatica ATCC 64428]|uniref:TRP C-terminal domain-containing protein n=1 Tax=Fistulina hepatica ATCC 64428 TaxID=1128425 RepID=A0A0D7A974_9AGAR|nr:hypothetical protein FISHEDRAFT_47247 [Fistulina hepatica ATCC 64428]